MQSPIRIGICRPNRSDNGPTINCPTAKIARKTVMLEVTAALDTRRSAAIAGSEGRKMFVDRIPVAANAQITALQAMAFRNAANLDNRQQYAKLGRRQLEGAADGLRRGRYRQGRLADE
jgi:hypothetical protein